MPSVQMNTRIDAGLKSAGDAVFESIGYTPTRVVRAIWGFAERNRMRPDSVSDLLSEAEGPSIPETEERARKARLAESGPAAFENFLREMTVEEAVELDATELSPAETRERAAVERAVRKGWIDG